MDGYEATKRLREMERMKNRKHILIIAVSSNDEDVIVKRALAAGCDHYLVKPAAREVLWKLLSGGERAARFRRVTAAEARATDEVVLDPDLESALDGFLASRREGLDELVRALGTNDRDNARRVAHRLAAASRSTDSNGRDREPRDRARCPRSGDAAGAHGACKARAGASGHSRHPRWHRRTPSSMSGQADHPRVDDDPVVTQYLEKKLGTNYRVVSTNIPSMALSIARAEQPDLILVDVDMSGMDGFELCRQLKAENIADAPVLFLTGRTDGADEVRGFQAGGVDYIHKHLEREVLEARVRQQLQYHKMQKAPARKAARGHAQPAHDQGDDGRVLGAGARGAASILCGSPEDVVKHLMLRGYIAEETMPGRRARRVPT
jgi:DNA-binding response OmpR family regulator